MNIKTLLLSAGSTVLNTFAPGAGTMAFKLISEYMELDDSITPDNLTGDKVASLVSTKLTKEQQVLILGREVDLEIQLSMERIEKVKADVSMQKIQSEEVMSGNSPRPHAVKRMVDLLTFQVVLFSLTIFLVFCWNIYAAGSAKTPVDVNNLIPSGEIFFTLFVTPAIVIVRYFTNYSQDRKNEAVVASGGTVDDILGITGSISKRIRGGSK